MKGAIFLDKDGTLVRNTPYNVDPKKMVFNDHMVDGLKALSEANFLFIIVTNQSGIGRGYFEPSSLENVREAIIQFLSVNSVALTGFYFCPHFEKSKIPEYAIKCECRKPKPGLILQAAADHNIDLTKSWIIGDSECDIQAGRAAGCRTVLISTSDEHEARPDLIASDINEAASKILTFFPSPLFS